MKTTLILSALFFSIVIQAAGPIKTMNPVVISERVVNSQPAPIKSPMSEQAQIDAKIRAAGYIQIEGEVDGIRTNGIFVRTYLSEAVAKYEMELSPVPIFITDYPQTDKTTQKSHVCVWGLPAGRVPLDDTMVRNFNTITNHFPRSNYGIK